MQDEIIEVPNWEKVTNVIKFYPKYFLPFYVYYEM